MCRRIALFCAFSAMVSIPLSAVAVEALSTEELISHCVFYEEAPEGKDGIFCVRYIQGFIDGAIVTDERVTNNVADEYANVEAYMDRVIRSRLARQTRRFPSYYAEFCLGEPVPLKAVVELVIADLAKPELVAERPLARNVVYTTLRREFPCVAEPDE